MAAPTWMKSDTVGSTSVSVTEDHLCHEFTTKASTSSSGLPRPFTTHDLSSPDEIRKNMTELQRLEVLDLSNCDLVGGAAVISVLQFITCAPRHCKLALSSIDLSHNRLGDEGAAALARILHENVTKLGRLVTVNLFENGIRDHGALALVDIIKQHAAGALLVLENVELHDNDISEGALSAIDEMWTKAALDRRFPWKGVIVPTSKDEEWHDVDKVIVTKPAFSFLQLLEEELQAVDKEHLASAAIKLAPVVEFLKQVLWWYVAKQRKVPVINSVVFRIILYPTIPSDIKGWNVRALLDFMDPIGLAYPLAKRNDAINTSAMEEIARFLCDLHPLIRDTLDNLNCKMKGMNLVKLLLHQEFATHVQCSEHVVYLGTNPRCPELCPVFTRGLDSIWSGDAFYLTFK